MNWPAVRTVFFKEMREFMRDRRALFVGVVLPILLYPVLTLFITVMIGTQINNLTEEHYTIGVSPPAKFAEVKTWYQEQCAAEAAAIQPPAKPPGAAGIRPTNPTTAAGRSGAAATPSDDGSGLGGEAGGLRPMVPTTRTFNLDFVPVPSAKARQMLQEKSVKAVIEFEPTAPGDAIEPEAIPPPAGATEAPEPVIMVLKESADIRSRTAATYATGLLEFHRDQVTRERLRALGADPDRVLEPFRIDTSADISSKAEKGGALFGGMVPFILVIMLIGAASYPAMDVTTGERERGTMETLLIAPVRARDLVTGKFLAVFTMAVVACLFNVVSLGVSMYFAGAGIAQHLDLAIPWMSLPWVLLLLLPLAILFSALLMLAGSFAQSTKEAQTYLSPVLMAAMFPAMLAVVPGIELTGGWLLLPIGNVTLLSRDLLSGQVQFPGGLAKIAVVLGSTWLYAGGAVGAAAALFGREEVLYGEKPWRVLLDRKRMKPRRNPAPWEALFIVACTLPLMTYGGMFFGAVMSNLGPLWANLPAQLTALLLFPLLYLWRSKSDLRASFGLNRPPWLPLLGLPLVIAGAYLLGEGVSLAAQHFIGPDAGADQLQQAVQDLVRVTPLPVALLLIALLPAVCEELLFRGFLQQALEKPFGPALAILIEAGAFAIFHISPSRMPFTFVLGIVLGILAWRCKSVLPGMLLHFTVNGLSTWQEYGNDFPASHPHAVQFSALLDYLFDPSRVTWVMAATLLVVALGFLPMFLRPPPDPDPQPAAG